MLTSRLNLVHRNDSLFSNINDSINFVMSITEVKHYNSRRSYYLLVAITQDGYLKFEENREEEAYGAAVNNRNFLNGTDINERINE